MTEITERYQRLAADFTAKVPIRLHIPLGDEFPNGFRRDDVLIEQWVAVGKLKHRTEPTHTHKLPHTRR